MANFERDKQHGHSSTQTPPKGGLMEAVGEKTQGAIAAVGDALGGAKDTVQKLASTAGHGVAHAAGAVEGWASDAAGAAGGALKGTGEELTHLIRRYPIPACAIAVGIGFLFSRVIRF